MPTLNYLLNLSKRIFSKLVNTQTGGSKFEIELVISLFHYSFTNVFYVWPNYGNKDSLQANEYLLKLF